MVVCAIISVGGAIISQLYIRIHGNRAIYDIAPRNVEDDDSDDDSIVQ